jgi:hypothetical protein
MTSIVFGPGDVVDVHDACGITLEEQDFELADGSVLRDVPLDAVEMESEYATV